MPKRILVVDDDKNIGQILYASFNSKGYETIVAKNGEDALTKFEELRPDLVLLDVLLPKMNGWEVCRKIKEGENSSTPVILMSAIYKSYKLQADARQKYGADDFVEKPFQLSKLLEKIYSFIGEGDAQVEDENEQEQAQQASSEKTEDPGVLEPNVLLEGDLDKIPFPQLLHSLYVLNKTGSLNIQTDGIEKEVAIKEGYPVSVSTNIESEYFGNFLVRLRKITPEICAESVERLKTANRLQGTILIEMGELTPNELVYYLRLQMREKLFEIFSWRSGNYRFVEDPTITGDISQIDMSVANVINEGVRRHYDMNRLLPLIEPHDDQYVALGSDLFYRLQDLELTPTESRMLDAIDGTQALSNVMATSGLDMQRSYQIIYALWAAGMIEFRAAATKPGDEEQSVRPTPSPKDDTPPEPDAKQPAESAPTAKPKKQVVEKGAEEPTTEEAQVRRKVYAMWQRVQSDNHFEVLGIGDEEPTESDVRAAYHRLAKDFHPDRFFGKASKDVRDRVEEIFRRVLKSYEALQTQKHIDSYLAKIKGKEEEAPKTDSRIEGVKKIIMAERLFQEGQALVKERRYLKASEVFRKATEISPSEAEYLAHLGWALYNVPRERDTEETEEVQKKSKEDLADYMFQGREFLNRAVTINPRAEKAYLYLGHVYKDQGLKEFAEKQFEKALICNPNCVDALRELRLIKLEAQKAEEPKTAKERLARWLKGKVKN
ncbi:MAG: response regulator [Candidatus Alcyoniella australis]|nr:response regulator [Candidatus Alcyoniella australis]